MATDNKKLQPIIIKKIKKGGHGHHGGAWKIAYADFVTAMMAFFLLMWLLGSSSKSDLSGIADYFNTPLKVALLGGSSQGNSNSIIQGGGSDISRTQGVTRKQEGSAQTLDAQALKAELARQDARRIADLQARISALISSNARLSEYKSQIRMDMTPDGLRIQIVDDQNRPMFDTGSALVKPYMRDILREIGAALTGIENKLSLAGHTDSAPYGNGERGYSNWELSADRANASRRELVAGGLPEDKLLRVLGLASSNLLDPDHPLNPANRRISIIVMTRETEARLKESAEVQSSNAKELSEQVKIREETSGTVRSSAATASAVPLQPSRH